MRAAQAATGLVINDGESAIDFAERAAPEVRRCFTKTTAAQGLPLCVLKALLREYARNNVLSEDNVRLADVGFGAE